MEKQDISNPNIDWASLVRHVAKDQITVELADGTVAIAQVIPMKKSASIKDFTAMMSSLPSLGEPQYCQMVVKLPKCFGTQRFKLNRASDRHQMILGRRIRGRKISD